MWTLNTVSFENLLSHVNSSVQIQNNNLTLIYGQNQIEEEGANSNGSGKSTIAEAIHIGLFGESYRDISKDDFIRNGEKECKIYLELSHPTEGILEIRRSFKRGKSSTLDIWLAGNQMSKISSVDEGNRFILQMIDIAQADLCDYFIINQGNDNCFLTASDTIMKRIITRFTNTSIVEDIEARCKSIVRNIDTELIKLNTEYLQQQGFIETLKEDLNEREKADSNQSLIESLEDQKNSLLVKNKKLASSIEELEAKIPNKQQEQISAKKRAQELEAKIAQKSVEFEANTNRIRKQIKEDRELVAQLEGLLVGLIECPQCHAEFTLSDKSVVSVQEKEQLEKDLKELNKAIKDNDKALKKELETQNWIFDSRNHLKTLQAIPRALDFDIEDIKKEVQRAQRSISNNLQEIKNIDSDIVRLKTSGTESSTILSLQSRIKQVEQRCIELQNTITQKHTDLKNQQILEFHFSKKGFQTYLANQAIFQIEQMTNHFLQKFNTNLIVQINGFTKLKNGDIRDKIEINVLRDQELFKLNKLSGGEKNRLRLANILALQKLINLSAQSGGLNFLFFDETFENLDRVGQIELIKCMKNTNQTILSISHQIDDLGIECNKILVRKTNRVSVIDS